MAAPTLCLFNKFGYCKYNETCRKHHVNEKCKDNTCDISKCKLRHPKLCKFFRNYGYCKFSPCAFKHEQVLLQDVSNEIEKKVKAISWKKIVATHLLDLHVNFVTLLRKLKEVKRHTRQENTVSVIGVITSVKMKVI
jgi:hypothetical protein